MLDDLTLKFTNLIKGFASKKRVSDSDLDNIIKKTRRFLLDADVALDTVKYLTSSIRNKLVGLEINKKISPGQLIIKTLYNDLVDIMSCKNFNTFKFDSNKLNVVLFVGLQGVGKTTTVAKFAYWLKRYNKKVLLATCDIYRPAAMDQLNILAKKSNVDFFKNECINVTDIVNSCIFFSKSNNYDFLVIDSAGRTHIDDFMINEIKNINTILNPVYTFLVIDGIYGQDAVISSNIFIQNLYISGFIVTKMDSDTRGGVILSLTHNTGKPVYFLGIGEKINDLEFFYPDRIASRILGMGDIKTLLEEIEYNFDNNKQVENNLEGLNLNGLKIYLLQMLKLGGIKKIAEKIPLHSGEIINNKNIDDVFFKKMLYLIDSMTFKEKKFPNIINHSRKKRIITGAGCSIQDINKMLKYYEKLIRFSDKNIYF